MILYCGNAWNFYLLATSRHALHSFRCIHVKLHDISVRYALRLDRRSAIGAVTDKHRPVGSAFTALYPHLTLSLYTMAAMQKAVVTIGQDKIIRSVNREAVRLFGYKRAEELIG